MAKTRRRAYPRPDSLKEPRPEARYGKRGNARHHYRRKPKEKS